MTDQTKHSVRALFAQWKSEHEDLNQRIDAFREWTYSVSQMGVPKFGEAACKLKQFRKQLTHHFDREDQMGRQLADAYPAGSAEVAASRDQASQDHQELLVELDSLVERLGQLEPPFESWQIAMREVGLFIDRLDEHEEYEGEHIDWLAPEDDVE
ncbi:hemerythrin domain-containing protein [Novipirellula artificiosorum]|uniref:Hemerythrin-like domain-containing protein n=1 Tax=Novipirellula artificiosorum TaxID=2528016 RepID=A0A5C6DQX0_9BACT|nr:hemerythrin domain-containing protein [Novipirellula artificiosorum]TWU37406.1 hypothetical protein Poly41_35360 [Novipirellula artificiosorum]